MLVHGLRSGRRHTVKECGAISFQHGANVSLNSKDHGMSARPLPSETTDRLVTIYGGPLEEERGGARGAGEGGRSRGRRAMGTSHLPRGARARHASCHSGRAPPGKNTHTKKLELLMLPCSMPLPAKRGNVLKALPYLRTDPPLPWLARRRPKGVSSSPPYILIQQLEMVIHMHRKRN